VPKRWICRFFVELSDGEFVTACGLVEEFRTDADLDALAGRKVRDLRQERFARRIAKLARDDEKNRTAKAAKPDGDDPWPTLGRLPRGFVR
jgi:hypothetical protein